MMEDSLIFTEFLETVDNNIPEGVGFTNTVHIYEHFYFIFVVLE